MDKIINELNDLGNINPVDFSELEAAFQALSKVTETTVTSVEQAGAALKTVVNRLNSEKNYSILAGAQACVEGDCSTVIGTQSYAEGYYSTVYGSQSIAYGDFKTIYGEIR